MSKFDEIFNNIKEGMTVVPTQQTIATQTQPTKPVASTQTQVTPQQQKQALEQFAQAMGVDAAALQKAIDTLKQQKPATGTQPAV